jgi:drug/metabolite transporter (DMT)-like permease
MTNTEITVLLALGANIFFSSATLIFTDFSRKVSALWVNTLKAIVGFLLFGATTLIFSGFNPISTESLILFFCSGAMGLGIGDLFLFSAFRSIGPGRTLIFYGMEPILLGVAAYLLLGQSLDLQKFWGIFFFLICFFIFSFESRKTKGSWEFRGLLMASAGVLCDSLGVLLTRLAFEKSPALQSFEGNFYRFASALITFYLLARFWHPIHLFDNFKGLSIKQRLWILLGCFMGTYISLLFYLRAIQTGHLATVSGIAITSPLFATLLECVISKKWPTRYMWAALASFVVGFFIVLEA